MFDDIMETFVNQTAKQIATEHDDLMFSWLEPYGVTRENYMEFVPRIMIEEMPFGWDLCCGHIQHWFLDGNYIFSVEELQEWESFDSGNRWSCNVKFRQFIREKELDKEQED